jgi:hypothetical protein
MPSDQFIREMVLQAAEYPLTLRIAAWFLREGGTESDWIAVCQRESALPEPMMNQIHNDIRDIQRGAYSIASIPEL